MPDCIDLTPLAGSRYRLDRDPAYQAEYGEHGRTDDLWLLTVPCQFGHFYPHGAGRLGFATNNRGGVAKSIAALPFVRIEQEADDGFNLSFPAEHFDVVARLAKPRRRRQLTQEQKDAARERLAKYAFPAARQSEFKGVKSPAEAPARG